MRFARDSAEKAAVTISEHVLNHLKKDERVIWLVCGGSNIKTEVKVMDAIRAAEVPLDKLLILPMDERYGEPGHIDSNYKQLADSGFDPGDALWVDILAQGLPMAETVVFYNGLVQTSFASADYIVGVFGLGTDGHTAGVLPKTPAVYETVASTVGYDSPPFVRLTLAPHELIRTNTAFVLAYGEAKLIPLERLRSNTEPIEDLPSKLLYDIPEVTVYNDQIESEA